MLAIVAEQTGYPSDLLDLDLDLEADLGIDTVKQAETFAAIREAVRDRAGRSLALRDYPTLRHVVGFVRDRAPGLVPVTARRPVTDAARRPPRLLPGRPHCSPATTPPRPRSRRRVPTPVLRPALALCRPTGRDPRRGQPGGRRARRRWRGHCARRAAPGSRAWRCSSVDGAPTRRRADRARLDDLAAGGPVHGVYWLPALDVEAAVTEQDLDGWREALATAREAAVRGPPPPGGRRR